MFLMRWTAILGLALPLALATTALAQEPDRDRDRTQDETQDRDQDQTRDQDRTRDQDQIRDPNGPAAGAQGRSEMVHGWELMSPEEREAHRQGMAAATTDAQRQALRDAQRQQMEARARERGVALAPPHRMELEKQIQKRDEIRRGAGDPPAGSRPKGETRPHGGKGKGSGRPPG